MKRIFKAFFTVTSIAVITRGFSFIFKIFISRELGAEVMGLYQICFSVFSLFAAVAVSGIPVTISRITAETQALGDIKGQRAATTTALLISLMISMTVTTVFYSFPALASLFFTDERCTRLFLIILPTILTSSIYAVIRSHFWGKQNYFVYSMAEAADEIIKVAACTLFIFLMHNVISTEYSLAYAMLVSDCIVAALLIVVFFKSGGRLAYPTMGRQVVKSAAPLTITRLCGSMMGMFVSLALPAVLVGAYGLTNAEATAEYGRASGMVMPLLLAPSSVVGSLSVVMIPEIAARNAGGGNNLTSAIDRSTDFTCAVACAAFIAFAACGREIGSLLYADEKVGEQLSFAAFIVLPLSLNAITSTSLNSLGKENRTFISSVIGYVFLAAGILILPRYMGIYGYYTSFFVFHCVTLLCNYLQLNRVLPRKKSYLGAALIAISCAIALFTGVISSFTRELGNILSCIICLPVAAALYFIALRITGYMPKPSGLIGYIRK